MIKEFFEEARIIKNNLYRFGNFICCNPLTNDAINNGFKFLRLNFITDIEF